METLLVAHPVTVRLLAARIDIGNGCLRRLHHRLEQIGERRPFTDEGPALVPDELGLKRAISLLLLLKKGAIFHLLEKLGLCVQGLLE